MSTSVRLAELLAALSKATDLGMGHPVETALSTCVVATRLGRAFDLDDAELRDTYHLALLRYIGCNAETHAMAEVFGDELALRAEFAAADPGDPAEVGAVAGRYLRQPGVDLRALMHESFSGHCEVGQRLAVRMGLPDSLVRCLGQLYERWDGRGQPNGLRGDEVARPVLVVTLAEDAVVWMRRGGVETAVEVVRRRSGAAYDAPLAECFGDQAAALLEGLDEEPAWQAVLELEPGERRRLESDQLDRCCEAMADFADIKSPYLLGHSHGVAALVAEPELRRAALLHDLGRVGVSAGIWGKPGPLTEREWEKVRLHPYYTERVLAGSPELERLGRLAGQHHERLNGSGYHRGSRDLAPAARLLAAADAYQAMTEARPHRPALAPADAAAQLRQEVHAGRLDGDAAHAVLAAAGHRVPPVRRERPAGLSAREVEVLRLVARGLQNREIAEKLYLAPETVKRHVQHIYDKTGLNTRAGATLFAMENSLLE